MTITEFKAYVSELTLNKVEQQRITNLTKREFEFKCKTYLNKFIKDIDESDVKQIWYKLNQLMSNDDKFHKKMTLKPSVWFHDQSLEI